MAAPIQSGTTMAHRFHKISNFQIDYDLDTGLTVPLISLTVYVESIVKQSWAKTGGPSGLP